jgi:3',5'-cyclic AMP phosphodiesterase CpdA
MERHESMSRGIQRMPQHVGKKRFFMASLLPFAFAAIGVSAVLAQPAPTPAPGAESTGLRLDFASPSGIISGFSPFPAQELSAKFGTAAAPLAPRLPSGTAFTALVSGTDRGYRNAISVKGKTLIEFDQDAAIRTILPDWSLGSEAIMITVAAGRRGAIYSPFIPFGAYDHDDFSLGEVYLELPDGSRRPPTRILSQPGDGALRVKGYKEGSVQELGDDSPDADSADPAKPIAITYEFEIAPEDRTWFDLELRQLNPPEGKVLLDIANADGPVLEREILVDATPPSISFIGQDEGSLLRGKTVLDASAVDALTGLAGLEATFDDQPINLPYAFDASFLKAGNHVLALKARDGAGNEAAAKRTYRTETENPDVPFLFETGDEKPGMIPVTARDPQGDALVLKLKSAWKLSPADGSIHAFAAVYGREPPVDAGSAREVPVEASLIAARDGRGSTLESESGFPGHRFVLHLPDDATEAGVESLKIRWNGETLPGRTLSAWAWDYDSKSWTRKAASKGGPLEWDMDIPRELRDGKAEILVLDPPEEGAAAPFTIAWMSDPQYYAANFHDIYASIARWAAEAYRKGEISYLVDTGDIVDNALVHGQWVVANDADRILDEAGLPYGIAAGNHDVQHENLVYDTYLHYFGDSRFADRDKSSAPKAPDARAEAAKASLSGGSWRGGIHRFDLISFGSYDFLFLYLGYGFETDPDALTWAEDVLASHPDRIAVIALHSYLDKNGARNAKAEEIFRKLVMPHDNVSLVLCGHIHGAARTTWRLPDARGGTRTVHELLADYQSGFRGGEGFIRLLTIDPARNVLSVRTYSPYKDAWNFFEPGVDEFELDLSLPSPRKRITTDSIEALVFGAKVLSESGPTGSGKTAWMRKPERDGWYVEAEDPFGATSHSDVF